MQFRRKDKSSNRAIVTIAVMLLFFLLVTIMNMPFFSSTSTTINVNKRLPSQSDIKNKIARNISHRPNVHMEPKSIQDEGKISKNKPNSTKPNYHIVFSTDCSGYQKWQTYLLFYSAYKVKQQGTVTRIASGCTDKEEAIEREFHSDISKHMSPNFKLHLTPQFSTLKDENGKTTGKKYSYFNKPFGLLHWIEHSGEEIDDDDIIILMDPDQLLLRKITNDFSDRSENVLDGKNPKTIVTHGSPFAQKYAFGTGWMDLDAEKVSGMKDTPAKFVSRKDAYEHYPAGPPYLATARDMHQIARKWAEFAPRTHKEHPHLMAEMYAYCIAAAHLELPHQIVRSLMVSDVDVGGGTGEFNVEGWKLVNAINEEDICSPTVTEDNAVPSIIHYCQRYILGKHFFGKRRMPLDIFSCESPLLAMPPEDIASKYTYYVPPSGTHGDRTELKGNAVKQHAFMLCLLTRLVNEASSFYQSKNCENPKKADMVLDFWLNENIKKQ